ncbi:MAG: alpha/beta fold hydrolase [Thermoplasmata archaeon]
MFRRSTPRFLDRGGRPIEGSVASLTFRQVGGVAQAVLIRGIDRNEPVLLYLHGGPGDAEILNARRHQAELERAFVVANWDQRGAGLSYSAAVPRSSMTLGQLVEDTIELSRWLAETFGRERIVLAAHSFGTIIGLLAAQRAPELFTAYVGIGQVVEPAESERRMYDWALAEAGRRRDARTRRALEGIGPLPHTTRTAHRTLRGAVARFGGRYRTVSDRAIARDTLLHLREYTLLDLGRWRRGERFSVETLLSEAATIDMARRVTRLLIPTYFVAGRYDRICDPDLAREYLRVLDAPRKGWAWIEDAAHLAPFEEPDAVAAALAHFSREAESAGAPAWTVAG